VDLSAGEQKMGSHNGMFANPKVRMRNEKASDPRAERCIEIDEDVFATAERELAAFANAVHELFGSESVGQSIGDWIEELELTDWLPGEVIPNWRLITIAAAARLATRMNTGLNGSAVSPEERVQT
jgi:hypothetical protein